MRSLVFVFALVAAASCKKAPPVEEPDDVGSGSGTGTGTGTGSGTAASDTPPQDLIDAQGAQITVLEGIADAAAASTPDCVKMGGAMNQVLTDGEAALHAMDAYTEDQIRQYYDALNDQFGARIDASMAKLGDAVEPCEDDPAIQETLRALGLIE